MPRLVRRMVPVLTLSGAVPFYAALVTGWAGPALPVQPERIFLIYGAVIASFMAGAIWGLALKASPARLVLLLASNAVALIVWAGTLLGGTKEALAVQLVAFIALLPCDKILHDAGLEPDWYWSLRKAVTAIVALAYGSAFMIF